MKNKKILITGATGFIGSHLAELCVKTGYRVVAFDRYNSNNDEGWLKNSKYKKDINIILGDIRDYDSVFESMKGCDAVFHLAALIGIPYSYVSPLAYIRTNLEGTYNVLESSRRQNTEQVIITSTSETYGSAQYIPIDEKHPLVGQSPYSASKISADQLSISYNRSFNLPVKIIRPFNTYGPRQSARAIIPTIISQSLFNKNYIEIGNIFPKRDFTHVIDTCNSFLSVYKSSKLLGKIVNVGMNNEISIEELANKIIKITGCKLKIKQNKKRLRPVNSEVDNLKCDNSLLLKYTSWKPKYNFDSGLEETIKWFKESNNLFSSKKYYV